MRINQKRLYQLLINAMIFEVNKTDGGESRIQFFRNAIDGRLIDSFNVGRLQTLTFKESVDFYKD